MDFAGSYNGLSFGPGTDYRVRTIRWWRRNTAINTTMLPRYHGGIPGASYESPRQLEVEFLVVADTPSDLATKLDVLYAAFSTMETESAFVWEAPGQGERLSFCRPIEDGGQPWDKTNTASSTMIVGFRLLASDPAIYGPEQSVAVPVYTSAEGLSYPVTYPKLYGSGGTGGGVICANSGEWETWPTLTIAGPTSGTLTNPILQNVTTGLELALTRGGGASITSGQTLVVVTHPRTRSVAYTTGASRYGSLSDGSVFWPLQPGNNEVRFRAAGSTDGATMTVTWLSAYI